MSDQVAALETLPLEDESKITADNTVAKKWGKAVGPGSGWVAVPLSLLRLQQKYELNPTEMLVLINLLAHWWSPESNVYPRNSIVAKRMGVEVRTVQRATKKLLDKGLIHRITLPNGLRAFSFDRLVQTLSKDVSESFGVQAEENHDLRARGYT